MLPQLDTGKVAPGSLTVSARFLYEDPAAERVRELFFNSGDSYFSIRYRSDSFYRNHGPVTSFFASPLGLEFTIACRTVFLRVST